METALILFLGIAALLDWHYRRIPNALILIMAISGLFWQGMHQGLEGAGTSFLGLGTGLLLLYIPFALGGVGGGDVKLLAAIGAWAGPAMTVQIFLAAAVAGGIYSLFEITRQRAWRPIAAGMRHRFQYFVLHQKLAPESQIRFTGKPIHIPYALAITAGYLLIASGGGEWLWNF